MDFKAKNEFAIGTRLFASGEIGCSLFVEFDLSRGREYVLISLCLSGVLKVSKMAVCCSVLLDVSILFWSICTSCTCCLLMTTWGFKLKKLRLRSY